MKKWYYLLILAILPVMAAAFTSCDDDDDLPDVNISLTVDKGKVVDDVMYVVQGDTLQIASINVENNDNGKGAGITNVNYYWDGYYYAPSVFSPFGMTFPTSDQTPIGDHSIDITCTVLAVDKSISTAVLSYPVKVVASADDIPQVTDSPKITKLAHLDN